MSNKLRLGIDVGGTFTDVVAVDATTRTLVARVKVPTTHDAPEGVAAGIVAGIEQLLAQSNVRPQDVGFIAHSTTQATNALLEGDVAKVGIVGLHGPAGWLARRQMRFAPVALAPDVALAPRFAFARAGNEAAVRAAVDELLAAGAEAIAATQPFGVDDSEAEESAVTYARSRGADATSGHDVSSSYGLRARTRTAALNAAILPRMIRTSRMTADAVKRAAIPSPLMIMRSDGGVMDVREIERRPILTLLSGPAAGVAGALLYDNVSDGIFVEVGGTSSDCSAIRAGRPQMHPAKIGGHRAMLRTIDVRTLGVAGGSLLALENGKPSAVGPRSAHIAGYGYSCFAQPEQFESATIDRETAYAVVVTRDGARFALTPTCAANLLGSVPEGAFARGNGESARRAFAIVAQAYGGDAESLARSLLELAAAKLRAGIDELIADYGLDRAHLVIVGGGGAAGALVPFTAQSMGLTCRIARDAEVISPLGVALALVRDVVERTIVNPTPEEIARLRREAADRVVAAGASPERVEVQIEIDAQRNFVRATASGASEIAEEAAAPVATESERREAAARSMRCEPDAMRATELTKRLAGYECGADVRVVDERGVVRLSLRGATIERMRAGELETRASEAIESATRFGDVGRALPAVYLLRDARVAAFEGAGSATQAVALLCEEIEGCDPDEIVALLTLSRLG